MSEMPDIEKIPHVCEACGNKPERTLDFTTGKVIDVICDTCKNLRNVFDICKIYRDGCPWCFSELFCSIAPEKGYFTYGKPIFWAKCGIVFYLTSNPSCYVTENETDNLENIDSHRALAKDGSSVYYLCYDNRPIIQFAYGKCSVVSGEHVSQIKSMFENEQDPNLMLINYLTDREKYVEVDNILKQYRKVNRPDFYANQENKPKSSSTAEDKKHKSKSKKEVAKDNIETDKAYSKLEI
jgi:hypothetical protein